MIAANSFITIEPDRTRHGKETTAVSKNPKEQTVTTESKQQSAILKNIIVQVLRWDHCSHY